MSRATDPDKTVVGAEELTLQVSADGTVTSVNEPMAKLLGIANREWARRPAARLNGSRYAVAGPRMSQGRAIEPTRLPRPRASRRTGAGSSRGCRMPVRHPPPS